MKIYLDVCCLCRPFDDQTTSRIRLEAIAVHGIIRRCTTHEPILVTSEAVASEISMITDTRKRLRMEKIESVAQESVLIDEGITSRMREIIAMGIEAMNSLHIACAERAGSLLLTTDDELITFFKSGRDIQVQ